MPRTLTIEHAREVINNEEGYELISATYVSAKSPLEIRHNSHSFTMSLNKFKRGRRCSNKVCSYDGCIPVIDYIFNGENHKYFPDIFLPSTNTLIEVKSTYTLSLDKEKIKAKLNACIMQGYNIFLYVYDKNGVRANLYKMYA
jgi:hypothetical protein